ncbi:MAG: hypothetical protein ACFFDW_00845 [Candidatus Thorarchaeota archaeon]
MADNVPRFCKFCGESVEYLPDFKDYFCRYCNSYQTTSVPFQAEGKKPEKIQINVENSLPPDKPPVLPPEWRDNIPIFRHREYLVVQAMFSWGPKYDIYNITGLKMGECRGKILSWGGEFDFFDTANRHVAKVKGNPTLLNYQTKTWDVYDYAGKFKGAIKSHFGFFKRKWELYNEHGQLVALPNEQIWLKYNWQAVDTRGTVLIQVDKQFFTFRDKFRVVVHPQIDPLLALAYAISIDYMYFQKN